MCYKQTLIVSYVNQQCLIPIYLPEALDGAWRERTTTTEEAVVVDC